MKHLPDFPGWLLLLLDAAAFWAAFFVLRRRRLQVSGQILLLCLCGLAIVASLLALVAAFVDFGKAVR